MNVKTKKMGAKMADATLPPSPSRVSLFSLVRHFWLLFQAPWKESQTDYGYEGQALGLPPHFLVPMGCQFVSKPTDSNPVMKRELGGGGKWIFEDHLIAGCFCLTSVHRLPALNNFTGESFFTDSEETLHTCSVPRAILFRDVKTKS